MFCAIQKDELHSVELVFVPAQKVLKWHLNAVKFIPAQNILGPVKGQGISGTKYFGTALNAIQFWYGPKSLDRQKTVLDL